MGALGSPKAWIPYMNSKECSQQICSFSCPQWCYIVLPPPPPPPYVFIEDKSRTNLTFSPLVIAIIGVLASAFLLVSYYAIVSKYCGNSRSSRNVENEPPNEENEEEGSIRNHEFSLHEPWFIRTNGLDEALIKSITLVKYKKEDGLIAITNCSICLGEFLEDDSLRLLPKCNHAFHVSCIDTWLTSHTNCPLCRANIVSIFVQPLPPSPPHDHASLSEPRVGNDEISSGDQEGSRNLRKNPFRSLSDIASRQSSNLVPYVKHNVGDYVVRRSISMDHSQETSVSIPEILSLSHGEDCQGHNKSMQMSIGESSNSKNDGWFTLKRTFSSGRFLLSKHCKGSNAVISV